MISSKISSGTTQEVAGGGRVVGHHGNTSQGRLDKLDTLLQLYEPSLFAPTGTRRIDVVVDVGFGDAIHTFADFAKCLATRRAEGTLCVIGTESDEARLESGRRGLAEIDDLRADTSVTLRAGEKKGWFELPLEESEPAPVFVRALNILRDYHPHDAWRGLRELAGQLAPGGLLMEGSASTEGDRAVVALVRRSGDGKTKLEAVGFSVELEREPRLRGTPLNWFTRQIPQQWQHHSCKGARPPPAPHHDTPTEEVEAGGRRQKRKQERRWRGGGGTVSDFLAAWEEVCESQRRDQEAGGGQARAAPREVWLRSIAALAARVPGVDTRSLLTERGFLVWRPLAERGGEELEAEAAA